MESLRLLIGALLLFTPSAEGDCTTLAPFAQDAVTACSPDAMASCDVVCLDGYAAMMDTGIDPGGCLADEAITSIVGFMDFGGAVMGGAMDHCFPSAPGPAPSGSSDRCDELHPLAVAMIAGCPDPAASAPEDFCDATCLDPFVAVVDSGIVLEDCIPTLLSIPGANPMLMEFAGACMADPCEVTLYPLAVNMIASCPDPATAAAADFCVAECLDAYQYVVDSGIDLGDCIPTLLTIPGANPMIMEFAGACAAADVVSTDVISDLVNLLSPGVAHSLVFVGAIVAAIF